MVKPEEIFEHVRRRLVALITHERAQTGSTVVAQKAIARRVGVSHPWIKRIVGRYAGVTIHAHTYLTLEEIYARYERTCRLVEQQGDQAKAEALRLEKAAGDAHETSKSDRSAGGLALASRRGPKAA